MHRGSISFQKQIRRFQFSVRIALRYLFSKKSHNAINIISAISVVGVAVGTMALVIVMSVFNGFGGLITNMFSSFDPELQITATVGKYFDSSADEIQKIKQNKSVAVFSEIVEDNALLRFKDKQLPATIKGVSDNFAQLTNIDTLLYDGDFVLYDGAFNRAVVGLGIAGTMGLNPHFIDPLYIYAPKREGRINLLRPDQSFNQSTTFVSGIFTTMQNQYDDKYVIIPIRLARELFEFDNVTVTSICLKLKKSVNLKDAQKQFQQLLGSKYTIKDRYEQQESFFKIVKIEKWMTFLILSFILLIASFNIIGSLSMLIIDKKNDIATLESLGAEKSLIRRIFLFEGWLISITGAVTGVVLGTLICKIQEHYGIVKLGPGFVVEVYPVITNPTDIIYILTTVMVMGFLAAWYPVRYIK